MTQKIEKHYTGGGITLAEAELEGERYAVVSTEALDCIAIYNKVEDEEPYAPEDMIEAYTEDTMPEELKALHRAMVAMLQ